MRNLIGPLLALASACGSAAPRPSPPASAPSTPGPTVTSAEEPSSTPGTPEDGTGDPSGVALQDPRCPAQEPEEWSVCKTRGLSCFYACANAPQTSIELVCSYDELHWVPSSALVDGVQCP